jgi:hypothetical protein
LKEKALGLSGLLGPIELEKHQAIYSLLTRFISGYLIISKTNAILIAMAL